MASCSPLVLSAVAGCFGALAAVCGKLAGSPWDRLTPVWAIVVRLALYGLLFAVRACRVIPGDSDGVRCRLIAAAGKHVMVFEFKHFVFGRRSAMPSCSPSMCEACGTCRPFRPP